MSGLRERVPAWAAWSIVLFAAAVVFGPPLSPDQALYYRDHLKVFRRLFTLVGDAYRAGRLPLWDPWIGGGEPLAAYPAALAFSPLHALQLVLPRAADTYDVFVVACYPIGGAGAYLLARALGVDARGRLVAAVLFTGSGPLLSYNCLLPALHSAVFAPWVMWAALGVWRRPSALGIALLAGALALHAHATDPALIVCDVIVFPALLRMSPRPAQPAPIAHRVTAWAIATGLALLLAMIQVLPLAELLAGTTRAAGYARNDFWAAHPLHLTLGSSMPGLAGDITRASTLFSTSPRGDHYLGSLYLSAIALPTSLVALTIPRVRWLAAAALASAALAVGDALPVLGALQELVPLMKSSRFPVKYTSGLILALPILVPVVWTHLSTMPPARALAPFAAWLIVCGAVRGVPGEWWLGRIPNQGMSAAAVEAVFRAGALQSMVVVLAVMAAWILSQRDPRWGWAIPAVLALDLMVAGRPVLPTEAPMPPSPPPLAQLLLSDAPRPVLFRYESPATGATAYQVAQRDFATLEVHSATEFAVHSWFDIDVNDNRSPAWRAAQAQLRAIRSEPDRLRFLGRLGHTHLVVSTSRRELPGLEYVGTADAPFGPPVSLFRIASARPYATWTGTIQRSPKLEDALTTMTSSDAPERVVIGEVAVPSSTVSGAARITGADDDVRVTSDGAGILVLARRFDPSWRATVDGAAVETVPVDVLLTGVPVPAGEHRVRLHYAPRSVTVGGWLSLLGLIGVLALGALGARGALAARAGARRGRASQDQT